MKLSLSRIRFNQAPDINKGTIVPEKISPELAEETGLHIGDGTMNYYKKRADIFWGRYLLRGHMIDDRTHYETRIKFLYKHLYNLDLNFQLMKKTRVFGFQVVSNTLVDFKHQALKLPLGEKSNIRIPKCILATEEYTIPVIKGIFDTDGAICFTRGRYKKIVYPSIEITTISYPLAFQINKCLSELNFNSKLYKLIRKSNKYRYNIQQAYVIKLYGEKALHQWFEIIKPNNQKHTNKYQYFLNDV